MGLGLAQKMHMAAVQKVEAAVRKNDLFAALARCGGEFGDLVEIF